jgi:hypothetical protein
VSPGRLAALALAALLVGACGPVTNVVQQLGGTATAAQLAGPWQPRPFLLAPELVADADRLCRKDMAVPATTPLVLIDARGGGRLLLFYASPAGDSAECDGIFIDALGRLQPGGAGQQGMGGSWPPLGANAIVVTSSGGGGDAQGRQTDTHRAGRSGAAVTRVAVRLSDRTDLVDATVSDGWWAVWWPGAATCTGIVGFLNDGTEVAQADC